MQLQVGDKFSDESGQWEVITHPSATGGGKSTSVRVQRVDKPGATETRLWSSYERVAVMRRAATRRANEMEGLVQIQAVIQGNAGAVGLVGLDTQGQVRYGELSAAKE